MLRPVFLMLATLVTSCLTGTSTSGDNAASSSSSGSNFGSSNVGSSAGPGSANSAATSSASTAATSSATSAATSTATSTASSAPPSSSDMGTGGRSTFLRIGFFDQRIAAGPDGTMHLAFGDGAAESVHYASCDVECGDTDSWTPVQLQSSAQLGVITVGPYGLDVDASGRVHMLVGAVTGPGQTANGMMYGTCASNCGSAAGWTFVDLSSLAPGSDPILTNSTFMVEPGGRVSFLTSGQYNSYMAQYLSCDSGCTSLGAWSAGAAINGLPLAAAQDAAGVTHAMVRLGDSAAGERLLYYARCTTGCTSSAAWEVSGLGFLHGAEDWATGFAVTPSGRVFMAYNQGVITVSTEDNRKMFINSCAGSTCLDLGTWSAFTMGDLDEGFAGAWLAPAGEAMVLASVSEFELRLRACEGNCAAGGSWAAADVVDDSDAMNAYFAPDTGSACPGTSESASWWPRGPRADVGSRGLVVVHNPYAIVKCPGNPNPSRIPTLGRVISTF